MRNILIFILILWSSVGRVSGQEAADSVQQTVKADGVVSSTPSETASDGASQAYRNQDYKKSIALYEKLIAQEMADDKV